MSSWEEYKKKKYARREQNKKQYEQREIEKKVNSIYNKPEEKSFLENVNQRFNQMTNDIGKIGSNFVTSTSSNLKNSLYYIESASNNNFGGYKFMNQQQARFKEEEEQQKKLTEEKSDKNIKLPITTNIRDREIYQGDNINLRKSTESPIQKALNESIQKDEEKIQQNIESTETKVGRKFAELTPSINQSLTGMAFSALNPALGIGFFQTSAGGNYTREAKAKGMNDEQSFTYGTIMGALESATESVGNKLTTNIGKAFFKDGAKEGLKAFGLDIAENFLEEAVMEPLSEYVTQLTGGKADWENIGQRMWEAGINGAITSVIMGGASAGVGKAVKLVNKMQNGEQISQKEIADTLKEINKNEEVEIEKLLFESFKFTADDLMLNTDAQNKINDKLDNFAMDISKNEFMGIKPMLTMQNEPISQQEQQTTLKQGEMSQKQASSQPLGNEKYSIKMPNSNYKFEKTGNINEDNLNESMSKYFNNSEATKKLNATLKKIINDKNLSIKFDDTITDEAGNIIDGKYENGSITINPNSSKAFEYVATHELTHAIGTKEMLNMVEKYRKSNSEFNSKVETLLKNYNKSELTEEALADVSAELFGTQEFIANVKNTNPNLFQKIYNEIKYLWHQFRGYKNQNQFVEDLYNKWTKAYNSKAELNQTSKKMIVGENAVTVNLDSKNDAEARLNKGENKYLVFAETGWFRNKDGKMKTEIDDSKSKIILSKTRDEVLKEKSFVLSDILKHDKLYEAYPELKDLNVIFEKDTTYNGNYNPNTKEIKIDIEQYMDDDTYNQTLDNMLKRLREADSKNMLFIYDNDMNKINEVKRRNKKRNSRIYFRRGTKYKFKENFNS